MFLIIDIYRLGVVYPYLSTSISLDECDYYRYISHIIINVINNDEEIYIAIYLPKKFPDAGHLDGTLKFSLDIVPYQHCRIAWHTVPPAIVLPFK